MTAAEWLRARLDGAPEHLVEAMVEATEADPEAPVPDVIAAAALRLYARVVEGAGGREDAFPLLAADALLTHAFEAQAERAPDELLPFARRWGGAGRLAELAR